MVYASNAVNYGIPCIFTGALNRNIFDILKEDSNSNKNCYYDEHSYCKLYWSGFKIFFFTSSTIFISTAIFITSLMALTAKDEIMLRESSDSKH
jgi:hypothetical protein